MSDTIKEKRNWLSSKMCGCEIEIDAEWLVEDIPNPYKHPIPFTIKGMEIRNICNEHKPVIKKPMVANPFFDSPGYMKLPKNPTEAEKLYCYLFRYILNRNVREGEEDRMYIYNRDDKTLVQHG